MFKNFGDLITKIRYSEEKIRKRYLVVMSGAAMAVTLGLWLTYVNLAVPSIDSPEVALNSSEEESAEPGFSEVFGAGLNTVSSELEESAGSALDYLKDKLGAANVIRISRGEMNFILEGLEKIPATPLP